MTVAEAVSLVQAVVALVGVVSVVSGVVMSIRSFNYTRQKEADARRLEAQKPFLELRQRLYTEAVELVGILANPGTHTQEELEKAKKRFGELYVAVLSMVEATDVEEMMVPLAKLIAPELAILTPEQQAAYELSHALRNSFAADYDLRR